jgi:uncharacterized membrane protein (UPF0182 family)
VLFNFGKDSLHFGPKQVEARINQDPAISAQLTLWNQQGSGVIRGNLLVMPIADSLLYVEPIYLQAASGRIPELQRVIVATAEDVVMAGNLGLALVNLFGRDLLADEVLVELGATASTAAGAAPGDAEQGAQPQTLEELVVEANAAYVRGQERLRAGDWAGYGDEMAALQRLLEQLAQASGVLLPPVQEAASPPEAGAPPMEAPAEAPAP